MTIIEEIQATAALLRNGPKPVTEIKMHPDDYAELLLLVPTTLGTPTGFFGIRIIADVDAPRLPRNPA